MYYKFNENTLLPEKVNLTSKSLIGLGAVVAILVTILLTRTKVEEEYKSEKK